MRWVALVLIAVSLMSALAIAYADKWARFENGNFIGALILWVLCLICGSTGVGLFLILFFQSLGR